MAEFLLICVLGVCLLSTTNAQAQIPSAALSSWESLHKAVSDSIRGRYRISRVVTATGEEPKAEPRDVRQTRV